MSNPLISFPRAQQAQISMSRKYCTLSLGTQHTFQFVQTSVIYTMCRHCADRLRMSFVHGSVTRRVLLCISLIYLSGTGTRWLTRREKEIDLLTKLIYYGITIGQGRLSLPAWDISSCSFEGSQTLGEEYTDIWQYSSFADRAPPPNKIRGALIFLSTFPSYILAKWAASPTLHMRYPKTAKYMKILPLLFNVAAEANLALFYLRGSYHDLSRRLLGVQHVTRSLFTLPRIQLIYFQLSSIPENPHVRPPSYSLLGVLLGIRLLHRLVPYIQSRREEASSPSDMQRRLSDQQGVGSELFIDGEAVSDLLDLDPATEPTRSAEEDERTILDVAVIPDAVRAGRNCTLCLEERTDSCSTECGHLFCWNCIVGWGREKVKSLAP